MQTSLMPAPDQPQQAVGQRQIACGNARFHAIEAVGMKTAVRAFAAAALSQIAPFLPPLVREGEHVL